MKQRIKLLFVSPLAERSGAPLVLATLAAHLDRSRYEIVVVLPERGELVEDLQNQAITFKIIPTITESLLVTKGILNKVRLLRGRLRYTWGIFQELRHRSYQLLYVSSMVNVFPGIAGWLAGTPVLWHIHDQLPLTWNVRLKIWLIRKLARSLIFVSRCLLPPYRPRPRHQSWFLMPNPVELGRYQFSTQEREEFRAGLGYGQEDFVLLCVGPLTPWKGLDLLLRAFAALHLNYPDLKLLVVGDRRPEYEEFFQSVERYLATHQLRGKVTLMGKRTDIPELLAAVDLFVLPSRREVLPVIVAEAMAAAKPIIATDIGGVRAMLEGCGEVVKGGDAQVLVAAIEKLKVDEKRRAELGRRARKKAEELYDLETIMAQFQFIVEYASQGSRWKSAPSVGRSSDDRDSV